MTRNVVAKHGVLRKREKVRYGTFKWERERKKKSQKNKKHKERERERER